MYGRMLIMMIANLYISRLALSYLGEDKFGLVSVISGLVVIGSFLSTVLETTAQRYISESLISKSKEDAKNMIQSVIYVYGIMIVASIVIVEVIGIPYVNLYLNQDIISSDKINLLFQLSVVTFMVTSLSSVLLAILIAFENIKYYSLITILEIVIKLILIMFPFYDGGSVVYYTSILLTSVIISRLMALLVIRNKYAYINLLPKNNFILVKKMFFFVKWNIIGGFASVLTVQGLNIVVNLFQGLSVNAARAIATQLNMSILQMVNSVQLVFNPRIVRYYVDGNYNSLNNVFLFNAKVTASFTATIIFLIGTNINGILLIWLDSYPEILNAFMVLMLVELFVASYSGPLLSIVQASEGIKKYQIIVGGTMLLNVPVCFFLLSIYDNPLIIYYVPILIGILCFILRVWYVSKMKVVNIKEYFFQVVVRVTFYFFLLLVVNHVVIGFLIVSPLIQVMLQLMMITLLYPFIVINSKERNKSIVILKKYLNKQLSRD